MCHSVGVRRTSPVGRRDPLRGEVDREVVGLDDRFLLRGRRAPERGPQPREELVHAERLRDVVVRAGVERGDLVALGLAHGEHDDRNRAPAAQAPDHLDAVDPREAEVEDDEIRVLPGRDRQRRLAGRGEVDVVAARRRFVASARRI